MVVRNESSRFELRAVESKNSASVVVDDAGDDMTHSSDVAGVAISGRDLLPPDIRLRISLAET